ncbi:MAG: hypothetical protein DWH82_02065 [Planctomycetota bacterium]|nr:MAG: hypothetical protein DWH82_02065 [Planctomycetota bacterium]
MISHASLVYPPDPAGTPAVFRGYLSGCRGGHAVGFFEKTAAFHGLGLLFGHRLWNHRYFEYPTHRH